MPPPESRPPLPAHTPARTEARASRSHANAWTARRSGYECSAPLRHSLSISENPAEGHFTQGRRVHEVRLYARCPTDSQGSASNPNRAARQVSGLAGKREFYQVVRLFFTGRAMSNERGMASLRASDVQCLIQ